MSIESMVETIPTNESKLNFEKVLWIGVLFCTVSIPFLMTLIALVHLEDCPHQPFIPIVILLAGISMSLSNVINTADKWSPPKQTSYKRRKRIVGLTNLFINSFTIACFIAGCLWIYGKGRPSHAKSSHDYCNQTLYEFAFWLLCLTICFFSLIFLILVIGFIIKYVIHNK